jgi:nicotinate-nucleotide pyrophosphorylase (carboxylating)
MTDSFSPAGLSRVVGLALEEDVGRGDITTDACVSKDVRGRCVFRARDPIVVSGMPVLAEVFRQLDSRIVLSDAVEDGAFVREGGVVARVEGPAASILKGERVALNFLQRLSGTATMTRRYVEALAPNSRTRIADTRKTTPGLRALERSAVRAGGGRNHREDLASAVLIKDNHVAASGGIAKAVERCKTAAPHTSRIECEVDSLAQLTEALAAGVDIILLDNFTDVMVEEALAVTRGRAILEASGGITLERVARLSAMGVDVISVGALTHSAPSVDIGLDWET